MSITLREGPLQWVTDLNAVTTNTDFPTGDTAGIAPPSVRHGTRVHVALTVAGSTAPSLTVPLYGQDGGGAWRYLASLNDGNSISVNEKTWSPTATSIQLAEVIEAGGLNYQRFASRAQDVGGSTVTITTAWGFPQE